MAKKFDSSKFQYRAGKLYRNDGTASEPFWNRAKPLEIKQYQKAMSRPNGTGRTVNILKVQSKYAKYFGSSTKLTGANSRITNWARPLALSGGQNPVYGWERARYIDFDGKIKKDSSGRFWGANLNQLNRNEIGKTNIGKGVVLNGSREWIRQIQISIHQLHINAESFRIAVGHRAIKVFQSSFKYQQFWSTGTQKWAGLSIFTKKKRAKRGTGTKILNEYGDLYRSIKIKENASKGLTRIYTDIVHANPSKHKKHSICYAGYHNNPRSGDTYGNGWGKRRPRNYIQRQFIGHSDHIDSFAASIMKRYLFDSVFLIKKV